MERTLLDPQPVPMGGSAGQAKTSEALDFGYTALPLIFVMVTAGTPEGGDSDGSARP